MKGMRLNVYRSADGTDCTNGGITSRVSRLTVVGILTAEGVAELPKNMQIFSADELAPAVVLVPSRAPGYDACPHLVPLEYIDGMPDGHVGPMAGGSYAGTSDSRWAELGSKFGKNLALDVVAVHDRVESYSLYLALSD